MWDLLNLPQTKPGAPGNEVGNLSRSLSRGKSTVLFFHSASCLTCKALQPKLQLLAQDHTSAGRLQVAPICCDADTAWAPEMLRYSVDRVPCLVLLAPDGSAVAKSQGRGVAHMEASLQCLVDIATQQQGHPPSASKRSKQ